MIQGFSIAGSCQPVDAGDNTWTMQCAATLSNSGPYAVMIAAAQLASDGSVGGMTVGQLLPGQAPMQLPAPASGATWVISAETTAHARFVGDLWFIAALGIGVLAGLGAIGVVRAVTHR